jgi:hypothetical protein
LKNSAKLVLVLGTACCFTAAAPAHAQLLGVLNGVMNVANQATAKVGDKLLGADKPVDIEHEREKFMAAIQAQTAGMSPAAKARVLATWDLAEQGFLMQNAQAHKRANGPMIDWKEAAKQAAGGVMVDRGMANIFTSSGGLGSVLSGAAMDGIIAGSTGSAPARGQRGSLAATASQVGLAGGATALADAGKAGVEQGVAATVTGAVSGITGKAMAQLGFGASAKGYELAESAHPERFFGKHPSTFSKRDLYRENGNIGWKRIESSATAEAYAPVTGDDAASAAVFNFDPKTDAVVAAFRILTVTPDEFSRVVDGVSKALGMAPRYASKGSVMRAVFENGAFVTADGTKVTLGWSQIVTGLYAGATPAGGTEGARGAP